MNCFGTDCKIFLKNASASKPYNDGLSRNHKVVSFFNILKNSFIIYQGSYGILNTFIQDFSRTFPGQFMSFSRTFTIAKNEMALKTPSNTAGGSGGFEPPSGPGQGPGGGLGAKPSKAPEIFYFIVPENGL